MINNKTIVITGASGGIGQALAHYLARNGNTLILMGRKKPPLEELLTNLPGRHHIISADLNTSQDRKDAIDTLSHISNEIDILINNAGVSCFSLFEDMDLKLVHNLLETNLLSPIMFTHEVLPLLNANGAKIVNVGSTFGAIGYPGYSVYAASKFGLRGFSESLSRELSDTNIDVQYIAPRATQTSINSDVVSRMNKQLGNRMDDPSLVAKQICQAISKNNTVTYFGWPEKAFVYLNSIVRQLVDYAIKSQLKTIQKYAKGN